MYLPAMYLPSAASSFAHLLTAATALSSSPILPRQDPPPSASCHKWTLAGASPTAAYSLYNIKNFTPPTTYSPYAANDTESRLRHELSNCVISHYHFGVDPSNEHALFVTFVRPDFDKGCVERAVRSAGGPDMVDGSGDEGDPGCVSHTLPDTMGALRKLVVPFNAVGDEERADQGEVEMGRNGDGKTEDGFHWLKTGRPIWIDCYIDSEGVRTDCHEGAG